MGKLNYSTAKHLAEMIGLQTKSLEKLLREVECSRESILSLSTELYDLLEAERDRLMRNRMKREKTLEEK